MKVLVNLNQNSFTLDGVPFSKIYQLRLMLGDKLSLVSLYDRADILFNNIDVSDISIDGDEFENANDLMLAFEDLKANSNSGGNTPTPIPTATAPVITVTTP